MYRLWSFFIQKQNFTYLLLGALAVAGLYSLIVIPKESAPEVRIPIGVVSVFLPGASALDVETLITNKVEDQLSGSLENVKKVTSTSRESVSTVVVEFTASADLDKSIQDLKDEVDKVKTELPEEANDPIVSDVNFVNQPIYTFAIGSDAPPEELGTLAENLKDQLITVPGVSRVEIGGKRDRETQVVVRKEALASYGIRITDVIGALARGNANLPVGAIELDGVRYGIQFEGDINDPSEIRDLAITSINGRAVYVRDVADVYDGLAPETSISRISVEGKPSNSSLTLSVFKRSGGNITTITDAVDAKLVELQKPGESLDGVTVVSVFNSGEELKKSLSELTRTGFETVILVMLVLFLTVGWREALVASSSIPISFIIAFIGLYKSGNTINFVSLFALILAVGILVDAGIVIVESMYTFITKGHSRAEAALLAVKTYHAPLTTGILTTVAVFVPLFFISGVTGQFIATIPFTIIFVLFASLVVALVFVPLIGASTLTGHSGENAKTWQDRYMDRFQAWYRKTMSNILYKPRLMRRIKWSLIGLFFVSLLFPIIGVVKVIFFPGEDVDFLITEVEMPQGTPVQVTDLELRRIEESLYDIPEISSFSITAGASSQFGNNPSNDSKLGNIFINLKKAKDRDRTSAELSALLRERFRTIHTSEVRISEPQNGPPVGRPILVKFLGEDLEAMERLADASAKILSGIDGTSNITTSTKDDGTEFVLSIDKAKAAELGIDSASVASILRTAVQGTKATTIRTPNGDIEVIVSANLNPSYTDPHDASKTGIESIEAIQVPTPQGTVLLGSLLSSRVAKASAAINHEEGDRVATVGSDLLEGANARDVTAEFKKRAGETLTIPSGVRMVIGGENEEVDQSFMEMFFALIAGIIFMLAVLMFDFNSWRHSLYVLSIVPLTLIGIMVGLALTRLPLSFPSLLGFIALAGIIVNHTILLIDVINKLRVEHPDMPIHDVVIEGAAIRLRPITLTNITTVIGMIPLSLAGGLWAPLAIAIMFGLAFAAVITLLLVPILYVQKPGKLHF